MKTIIPLHGLADCFYHHPGVQLHIDKTNIGYTSNFKAPPPPNKYQQPIATESMYI